MFGGHCGSAETALCAVALCAVVGLPLEIADLLASIFRIMDDYDDENIIVIIQVRMFHLENYTQSIDVLVSKNSMRSACLSRAY